MPAEWEPHEGALLAWPQNKEDWPGKFQPIPWVFCEIIRHLTPTEKVFLIVASEKQEKRARFCLRKVGADLAQVQFIHVHLDRGWMRDCAPAFVHGPEGRTAVRFSFNGWAKYDNWRLDAAVPPLLAETLGMPLLDALRDGRHVVLEGGAIDINGDGVLVTTEECLLDETTQARNPGLGRAAYEAAFHEYLGIDQVLWLGGGILGDDTHGHVDDLCRFVNRNTVVLCQETRASDGNHGPLSENRERLQGARLKDGSRLEVVSLPMPNPLIFDGTRLPASYANFYLCNGRVLVPTFNDPNDRTALGILAECFPDRTVIGIHAVDLVWGFGTIHCLTHEVPRGEQGIPSTA